MAAITVRPTEKDLLREQALAPQRDQPMRIQILRMHRPQPHERSRARARLADDGAAQKVHAVLSPIELAGVDEARHPEDAVALDAATPSRGRDGTKRVGMRR